jgi:hypothetical protein
MSVSAELLCSFELLKPLDSSALKSHIKKGRNKRNTMLNSPVSCRKSGLRLDLIGRYTNNDYSLQPNTHKVSEPVHSLL